MADAKDPFESTKAWWRKLPPQSKWLVGGGAGLVALLAILALSNGGGGNTGYAPYGQTPQAGGYPGQGYVNLGYPGQPGYGQGQGQAGGDDPTGYWDRQRRQEQQARAFHGYITDTDTVRNNQTGEVYTDVPNADVGPAVQSGDYSTVPTPELPTSTPAVEPTPAPAE